MIGGAGYIAGPSKGGLENMNKAECHAYLQSYKYFDPIEMIFDQSKLKINYNAFPGVYYWHYHILGKRVDNRINGVHVFFGFPVFVKEEDIIKNLSEFNYDNFRINDSYVNLVGDYSSVNKFVKIKNLKKREGLDENKEFKV